MGPQFHETGYGRRFFDSQLPQLIEAVRELGQQVARQNVLLERQIELAEQNSAVAGPDVDIDIDQLTTYHQHGVGKMEMEQRNKLGERLKNIFPQE